MDTAAPGRAPLEDLLVLDLTIARAGPTAVRHLADWGARVLRIEPADPTIGLLGDHDSSDYINLHRSKQLIQLDLRDTDDKRRAATEKRKPEPKDARKPGKIADKNGGRRA